MANRNKIIKYYTDFLKENEILLLKSYDTFFNSAYCSSPLAIMTGFLGSEGEAIVDKNGKITIFVDTRYHILVDKQVYQDVEVYKMKLGESFFDAIKEKYPKNTILHVYDDILLKEYLKYSEYFDLRKYELKKSYSKNKDFNKDSKIYKISDEIENISFLEKINKLKKSHSDISKMIVFNLDEISYLTNLRSFQMKYSSNFRAILFLDFKNKNYILFSDKIDKKYQTKDLKYMDLSQYEDFVSSISSEIFINIEDINLKNYLLIKNPKEIKNDNLSTLASIRSKNNIENLKNDFTRLDEAIFNFKKRLKTGLSEYDLSKIFEEELLKTQACGLSFKTILAIDENSASIHYSTSDKNKFLKDESLILLDCGGYWKDGLATDITRTFYFGLNPSKIHKKIYTFVLKAFLACYLSNETNAQKLDLMARKILKPLEDEGFYFGHGLGHGIGTSVHQNPPRLSMYSKDIIKPYQVHSIEPGLYGKNKDGIEFGVRIENCVYTDLNFKKKTLSNFPFEEVLIDYSLLAPIEIEAVKTWQKESKWK